MLELAEARMREARGRPDDGEDELEGTVRLQPGVYLVAARGKNTAAFTAQTTLGAIQLGEFVAPPASTLVAGMWCVAMPE